MANRDTGGNYGNPGGNNPGGTRENQGSRENPRGQTPDRSQERGRNVPGQGQSDQGGQPGDPMRNQTEREWDPNDPNRNREPGQGGRQTDSDEEV
jgi:hypothetical protein